MPAEFTHLHNHTEYSLLDGLSNIPALVARASELGMKSLAITDHGGLYGAVEFYKQSKEFGIDIASRYVEPSLRTIPRWRRSKSQI